MKIRVLAFLGFVFGALVLPVAASAAWHKAESDRFIVYSNSRGEDLRELSAMLERFHVAMELESGRKVGVPSPSSRLTIYMVGSGDDLRKLYGNRNSNVGGFYISRANGSVAFVPNARFRSNNSGRARVGSRFSRGSGTYLDRSLSVLLHEYAHHFLISSSRHAMPRWLSEGAAEYFSSARFHEDGTVDIGLPNNERAWEISQAAEVPVQQLLDYGLYRENRGGRYANYYGRSWLLYHYLRFNEERAGQLGRYWQAVANGSDSLAAGEKIFGDLDELDREIRSYGRQRSMAGMRFADGEISIGEIEVSKLSDGHADMMEVIMRSDRGVDSDEARDVVEDARRIAANHPTDANVLAALAEAEYDAGNDDAAILAADRAIAIDPSATNAYVQKGYAMFRKAGDAENKQAAYSAALEPFKALNAIETDHTQPLIYFYRSFTLRGATPPDGAKLALERATQLAPFDKELALEAAQMKAAEGDPVIARYLLAPVAADPHGGRRGRLAQAMMDVLARTAEGSRVDLYAFSEEFEMSDDDDGEESGKDDEA